MIFEYKGVKVWREGGWLYYDLPLQDDSRYSIYPEALPALAAFFVSEKSEPDTPKVIEHRKMHRYHVERRYSSGWEFFKAYRSRNHARSVARSWERIGSFEYRVVDTGSKR